MMWPGMANGRMRAGKKKEETQWKLGRQKALHPCNHLSPTRYLILRAQLSAHSISCYWCLAVRSDIDGENLTLIFIEDVYGLDSRSVKTTADKAPEGR